MKIVIILYGHVQKKWHEKWFDKSKLEYIFDMNHIHIHEGDHLYLQKIAWSSFQVSSIFFYIMTKN